jgi:NADP-dependent 3-hydroxy acid dehydrogenase YdfG
VTGHVAQDGPVPPAPNGPGVRAGRALVVGASSAIGGAIARELDALGHELLLWGREPAALAELASSCRSAEVQRVDLTDHDRMRTAVAGARLSVVVHAAGVFDWAAADAADPLAWDRLLQVNLTSAAVLTPLVLPSLIRSAPSALVFVGSAAGRRAAPNNAAYIASKHGLRGLAAATFLDVRDRGVKVSLVSPGLVAAGAGLRSPAGTQRPDTLLAPQDVAAAVRFVVTFPARGCPTEIELQPQRTP